MLFLARLISYLFHPLWMPVYIFFLAVNTDPYLYAFFPREMITLFILILGINVIAPGLSMLFMLRKGLIGDLDVTNRKERLVPFLLVLMYYLISYIMLRYWALPVPSVIYSMFISVMLVIILALIVNAYWKISIHMMGVGGLLGSFLGLFYLHGYSNVNLTALLILIAALTGFARLYTNKHDLPQVYVGFGAGVVISFWAIAGSVVI